MFGSTEKISFFLSNSQVMGITALATFAAEISGGNVMSCTISYATGKSTVKINKENSLVLQSVEVIRLSVSICPCSNDLFFPFEFFLSFHARPNRYHLNVPAVDFR